MIEKRIDFCDTSGKAVSPKTPASSRIKSVGDAGVMSESVYEPPLLLRNDIRGKRQPDNPVTYLAISPDGYFFSQLNNKIGII